MCNIILSGGLCVLYYIVRGLLCVIYSQGSCAYNGAVHYCLQVLVEAQSAVLNYKGLGLGVMGKGSVCVCVGLIGACDAAVLLVCVAM